MIKNIIRLCFSVWILSGSTVLASHNQLHLTEQEQAWIKANPVVRVANEMDWPPFDYVDQGKPAGYSIDMIRLIKQKTGLQVEFVNGYTWHELLQQFKAGEIDIMPAIYVNDERSEYTSFTRSYYSQPSVMVVHKDNKDISDIASLTGKRVAGIRGFAITTTLKEIVPGIDILFVNNIIGGMKAVSLGEADAFIDSIGSVSYHLEHNYIPNLKIIGKFDNNAIANPPLHFGVAKDRETLRNILDKALASISREEKLTLEKRWIYTAESIEKHDISNKIVLTPEQQTWLAEHPVITIGIDADYAPYSFQDTDGNYIGVAPDFIALISDMLGVTFKVSPGLSWPQILTGAREHTLDVIATAVDTDERKSYLNFTQIYIPTPLVIMTRIDDNYIKDASDLDGYTIALVEGYSSSQRVIDEHSTANFINVANPTEGLHAVSSGKADAYVGVVGVNIHQAQKQGITNLKISANYDVTSNGQRFAIRSDWIELTQILERALTSITEAQRKAIYDKWIKPPHIEHVDYSLLWKLLILFLVIVSLMYAHSHRLSKEINRRKVIENKLLVLNESLAKARDTADKANQAKSDFLSRMNHELRTPMNAILGFSQILELNLKEEQNKQHVNEIINAGQHLLELINEVLDLSRIEAGRLDLNMETVSLNKVLSECLILVNTLANKRNIRIIDHISNTTDHSVHADDTRLKQVLLNLLSNAIKYNVDGGKVTLDCSVAPDNLLRIQVSDTGKGLTTKEQQKLFMPFERIGAETSNIEGTGIGLVITKQLIEKMGGQIGRSSQVGQGSSFWIEIPLSKQHS